MTQNFLDFNPRPKPPIGLELGREARDAGVAQVLSHNETWAEGVRKVITMLAARGEFTSDDVRQNYSPQPENYRAWGAALSSASNAGLIVWTGRVVQSAVKKNHAAALKVWRATTPSDNKAVKTWLTVWAETGHKLFTTNVSNIHEARNVLDVLKSYTKCVGMCFTGGCWTCTKDDKSEWVDAAGKNIWGI
jgi:hypothetical protein